MMPSNPRAERSIFDLPMTYSGLLDDVVDRYKITPEVDATFFNRSILRNVFFSGRILINDGYLVNHPAALTQLMNEDSLLRTMIKTDFVRVLARQQDADAFANNPEIMAERGVESFRRLIDRKDWPQIKERLRQFALGLYAYDKVDPWPPFQMHPGFRKLFSRIFDKSLDDLGLAGLGRIDLDGLRRTLEDSPVYQTSPRGTVEEVLKAMAASGTLSQEAVVQIMNVANQCYHYNFAMCLSESRGEAVIADTTIGKAFLPVLSIPRGFPMEDGAVYDRLLDPTSTLSAAKHTFLAAVDRVFRPSSNTSVAARVDEVNRAAEEYRRYLADHFSNYLSLADWAPRTGGLLTFGFGQVGSAIGADAFLLAANLGGVGRSVSSFIHRLTRPINRRAVDVALDPAAGTTDEIIFTVGEIRPRFASLAFDERAAKSHTSDIPKMETSR